MVLDYHHKPFKDYEFSKFVENLERAVPGQTVIAPINPDPWMIEITKI